MESILRPLRKAKKDEVREYCINRKVPHKDSKDQTMQTSDPHTWDSQDKQHHLSEFVSLSLQ